MICNTNIHIAYVFIKNIFSFFLHIFVFIILLFKMLNWSRSVDMSARKGDECHKITIENVRTSLRIDSIWVWGCFEHRSPSFRAPMPTILMHHYFISHTFRMVSVHLCNKFFIWQWQIEIVKTSKQFWIHKDCFSSTTFANISHLNSLHGSNNYWNTCFEHSSIQGRL